MCAVRKCNNFQIQAKVLPTHPLVIILRCVMHGIYSFSHGIRYETLCDYNLTKGITLIACIVHKVGVEKMF